MQYSTISSDHGGLILDPKQIIVKGDQVSIDTCETIECFLHENEIHTFILEDDHYGISDLQESHKTVTFTIKGNNHEH